NASDSSVFNINQAGDVYASGSGTFGSIKVTDNNSLGSATIPQGSTKIEIVSSYVKSSSKIFVTPTSITSSPLIVTEKSQGKFVVEVSSAQISPISFDWWIVGFGQ
ncbi:MAG TPA: hypothetical protein VN457_07490, partial [Chlamydiales bacterium]|nr:hypothetical protein [Chlamydiales bacterium]